MKINSDKINFIYNSIKRDVTQSNLTFWRNVMNNSKGKYVDVFTSIQQKAEKDGNINIIKFVKEVLTNNKK